MVRLPRRVTRRVVLSVPAVPKPRAFESFFYIPVKGGRQLT
jgi:hypothetical protein